MSPPIAGIKKRKLSPDHSLISEADKKLQQQQQQQLLGSFLSKFGKRRSVRVASKKGRKEIIICYDVWLHILPFVDRARLGLKLALLSDRFDLLVDRHFRGPKLPIWHHLIIHRWPRRNGIMQPQIGIIAEENAASNESDEYLIVKQFALPKRPLPNTITHFEELIIRYIDHSVLTFLRSNKHLWDRGTIFRFRIDSKLNNDVKKRIWDVLVQQIWPIFAQNMRELAFHDEHHLDELRRLISPTILTDLDLDCVTAGCLFPDPEMIGSDQKDATAEQVLSKWLHTPSADGQPKELYCCNYHGGVTNVAEWVNKFKQAFLSATTASSYEINLQLDDPNQLQKFELVNERTREKLLLKKVAPSPEYQHDDCWEMRRRPIVKAAAAGEAQNCDGWDDFSTIDFEFLDNNCIGPLCPPIEAKQPKKRRIRSRLTQRKRKRNK